MKPPLLQVVGISLCNEHYELHNRALHVSGLYKDYPKVNIGDEKTNIETPETNMRDGKVNIDVSEVYGDALKEMSKKTVEYIQNMFDVFGTETAFGRSDMQTVTALGNTRASAVLKNFVAAGIIETVTGYGKGKYKFTKKEI